MRHLIGFPAAQCVAGVLLIATAGAAVLTGQSAFEQRRDTMKQLGNNFYLGVGRVVKGRATFGSDTVAAAETVARLAAGLDTLFPPGSNVPDSKMKAELLADPERSAALIAAARAAADALVPAVRTGEKAAIAASYKTLGDACEACHTQFRKDE